MGKRIIKSVGISAIILVALIVLFYIALVWQNNRSIEPVEQKQLNDALDKSIRWAVRNENIIVKQNNVMLWWMIKESADITGDKRLLSLYEKFKSRSLDPYSNNVWRALFNLSSPVRVNPTIIYELPDYNILFIYGLTCDPGLAQEEIVKKQNKIEFCAKNHPISPACYTHQLMGIRFMQNRKCGKQHENELLAGKILNKIISQLNWDPRLVDVYFQRVLMVLKSDKKNQIKPVWVRNIINEQAEDGGWDNFDPLISIGASRYFGFSSRGFKVKNHLKSNFHATAQGIYLLSLLVEKRDNN